MKKKRICAGMTHRIPWCKMLIFMKFFSVCLLGFCLSLQATVFSQSSKVTLTMKQVALNDVFLELRKQTKCDFLYNYNIIKDKSVDVNVEDKELVPFLEELLLPLGLMFTTDKNVFIIKEKPIPQQQKEFRIEGIVIDVNKIPIPGVTVKVDGTTIGTSTNNEGYFVMHLPLEKGSLVFSFVGYKSKKIVFQAGKALNVTLEEDTEDLEEVIVRGYGTQKRREMISAISSVKAEDMKELPSASITSMLQGRMAGLNVVSQSGSPGSAANVSIRGFNSLVDVGTSRPSASLNRSDGAADGQPLYVVDGIPMHSFVSPQTGTNTLADLDPAMIASVEVLKDAAAASIYGSRASNGVILITTKKGRAGQTVFAANVSYTVSKLFEYPEQTGGRMERWIKLLWDRNKRTASEDIVAGYKKVYPISYEQVFNKIGFTYDWYWGNGSYSYYSQYGQRFGRNPLLQDSLNPFYNNETNWYKYAFRTASVVNANIQASGGSERIRYMIGAGYYNEKGIMLNSSYARANLLTNLNVKATERLSVDTRLYLSYVDRSMNSGSKMHNGRYEGMTVDPQSMSTLLVGDSEIQDEWLKVQNQTRSRTDDYRLIASLLLRYEFLRGLNLSVSGNADYSQGNSNDFKPSDLDATYNENISSGGIFRTVSLAAEALLTYQKSFKESHNIDLLLGLNVNKDQKFKIGGSGKRGYSDNVYYYDPEVNASIHNYGTDQNPNYRSLRNYESDFREKKMASFFGRIGYNYKQRYLIEFTMRRDGSSTFGEGNRWADFPSVAVGWAFSDEPFLKDRVSGWLDWAKIRASFGTSGQIFDSEYLAHGLMSASSLRFNNVTGMKTDVSIAPNLTWDKSKQYDIGLDLDMFSYRLKVKMDYYYKHTKGLLYDVDVPQIIYPTSRQKRNSMDISNEGIELELEGDVFRDTQVKWLTKLNVSRNWNLLRKTGTGKDFDRLVLGRSPYGMYVFDDEGYFQNEEEVPLYADSYGYMNYVGKYSLLPLSTHYGVSGNVGTPKLRDIDGDGVIDYNDQVYIGSPLPKAYGGWVNEIKWKDLDLNILISYSFGRKIINNNASSLATGAPVFVDLRKVTFWEKEGDVTDLGRIGTYEAALKSRVERVNHASLKQITLGYNLNQEITNRLKIKGARFFVTGENIFYLSNYSGGNPEVINVTTGLDNGGAYPLPQKWTLGLTLNF